MRQLVSANRIINDQQFRANKASADNRRLPAGQQQNANLALLTQARNGIASAREQWNQAVGKYTYIVGEIRNAGGDAPQIPQDGGILGSGSLSGLSNLGNPVAVAETVAAGLTFSQVIVACIALIALLAAINAIINKTEGPLQTAEHALEQVSTTSQKVLDVAQNVGHDLSNTAHDLITNIDKIGLVVGAGVIAYFVVKHFSGSRSSGGSSRPRKSRSVESIRFPAMSNPRRKARAS